jgi:para-nitrobenzyl esterase
VDRRLSDTLAAALVQFARTGTPNSRGLPNWPAYDERRERVLVIRERAEARVLLRRAALDFYDSVFGSAHPAGRGFPAVPQR